MSHATEIRAQLVNLINKAKGRYYRQFALKTLAFTLAVSGLIFWLSKSVFLALCSAIPVLLVAGWMLIRSSQLKRLNLDDVALHLNQRFPELEHSTQLLTQDKKPASLVKRLQTQKVSQILIKLLDQDADALLPRYSLLAPLRAIVIILAVLAGLFFIDPLAKLSLGTKSVSSGLTTTQGEEGRLPAQLLSATLTITPPAYTGLPEQTQSELDVSLIAGSTVRWSLQFNQSNRPYYIQLAGQQPVKLVNNAGQFELEQPIEHSGIYHISDDNGVIGSVYSIAATVDQAPQLRILAPTSTITEFAKNTQPLLQTKVQINDDFGLSKVDILASVAKGSGEAVKFRDQVFQFDSKSEQNGKTVYFKQWSTDSLDMEAGDELYFTVRAWDNKQPNSQLSRSITKIFRWLDDDEAVLMSDGILIDFMPEYFKSQRQIIIETKQLIADKAVLSVSEFDQTSRSLGHSQSDLKLKYGQYLGDEFDDGSGGQEMESGVGVPEVHVKDGDHNDEQELDDTPQIAAGEHHEQSHEHHEEQGQAETDKSGYQEIIEQFGHAHGDTDVGLFGTLSPTALMKQAIAHMWDAELHLMLSEPERALPFEEKALTYLNRARKAERIYVKRLGFEPPPVTEKRRYQGDLSDVLSYQQYNTPIANDEYQQSVVALLNSLNTAKQNKTKNTSLNEATLQHLTKIKSQFINQAKQRPAMVTHVATLEKMQLAEQLWISDCNACMDKLLAELWRQLPVPIAQPATRQSPYHAANELIKGYSEHLLKGEVDQ